MTYLDAVRAAREALTREHLAAPRARGDREAMRVLLTAREGAIVARTKAIGQLKAMIVNAPQSLRDQLRRGTTDEQLKRKADFLQVRPFAFDVSEQGLDPGLVGRGAGSAELLGDGDAGERPVHRQDH